jgi:hypothetical protein
VSHHRPSRLHRALVLATTLAAVTAVTTPVAPARLAPEAVSSERNPPFVTVTGARDHTPVGCRVRR